MGGKEDARSTAKEIERIKIHQQKLRCLVFKRKNWTNDANTMERGSAKETVCVWGGVFLKDLWGVKTTVKKNSGEKI